MHVLNILATRGLKIAALRVDMGVQRATRMEPAPCSDKTCSSLVGEGAYRNGRSPGAQERADGGPSVPVGLWPWTQEGRYCLGVDQISEQPTSLPAVVRHLF